MSFKLRRLSEIAFVVTAFAAVGCEQKKSKLDGVAPSAPATAQGGKADVDAQGFCVKTLDKVLACFEDTGFWDNFSTTWFAKYPDTTGNPNAKKDWIGMRKDDIVGLTKDKQLVQNCEVMVRLNKLPTVADVQAVTASMQKSCSAFGSAMGLMLFHNGVFHDPR